MCDYIDKTKILIQRLENWSGLKDRIASSVVSTNLLSQKGRWNPVLAPRLLPPKKQKFPLQFSPGDGRF